MKIHLDNARGFVVASKWLKSIMRDEKMQIYLAHHNII